jgi:GGDEF domain-containing protein
MAEPEAYSILKGWTFKIIDLFGPEEGDRLMQEVFRRVASDGAGGATASKWISTIREVLAEEHPAVSAMLEETAIRDSFTN